MQRQHAIDGARGFTVLFVPAIHTVMLYSEPYVHTTWLGYVLTFIAEGPGAQIFMTVMGIVFTFKKYYRTLNVLKRASLLLAAGYLLNALKFIVPFALGGLPAAVQRELQLVPGQEYVQLLAMGDILHFAAIALVIIHFVYRLRDYWFWSAVMTTVLIIIAPTLFDIDDHYLIALFTGKPPQVFFPVLSWIIYPMMGLTIGYRLQRRPDDTFAVCGLAGMILLLTGVVSLYFRPQSSPMGFYRPYPAESLVHVSVVLLSLWLWHRLTPVIMRSRCFALVQFASAHITVIYLFQWILICWLLPFTGYQSMTLTESIMTVLWISVVVFGFTYLWINYKKP